MLRKPIAVFPMRSEERVGRAVPLSLEATRVTSHVSPVDTSLMTYCVAVPASVSLMVLEPLVAVNLILVASVAFSHSTTAS